VILDMVMPTLNGPDTFVALRQADPSARILLASGYALDHQTQQLVDAGALGFIQKPFRLHELAALVASAME
jgi:DNA-binding NarL/FixJ family response regulator